MRRPRSRPGRFWLLFYGKRRRGFPGLLVGLFVASLVLAFTFALPHGVVISYVVGLFFLALIVLLAASALAAALYGALRQRGKR